ncbi:MAG: S8 family serine peptidase [Bacteroidales bacterium]|nr:S8 family serine peptidase [Bacteroidales bacterium]
MPSTEKPLVINILDNKDWGFIDFKIDELWKISRGKDIKVAVLDSGLNYNMDDFKNNKNISYYNAFMDSENKTDCLDDSYGHGTNCAGILCAQGKVISGVAPDINLLSVKITNETGERTSKAILKGLEKAIALNSDVISLSFSIAKLDENFNGIHDKIKEAYQKDIVVLAAAGDSGALDFPVDNFPASFVECLSIGGIDRTRKRSKYSTKSNFLDLMGPGEDLMSVLSPDIKINGTSFSTPFVAGVIALLKSFAKSKNLSLTNIEIYDILKRTADIKVADTYNLVDYGWGIMDPVAAFNLLSTK